MTTTNIDTKAARELVEAAEFGPWDNDVLTLCAELDSTRAELAAAKSEVERLRSELAEWKRDAIAANKEETRFREQYKAVAERCIHRNCKTPMVVGMDSFGYCEFHSNPTNRG